MTNYTTFEQSLKFKELDLPEHPDVVYCIIKPEYKTGWIHSKKNFSKTYAEGTEFTPAYSLDQMLQILSHYYKPRISQVGERYHVEAADSKGEEYSVGAGKTIAEAAGWLLLHLIKNDKFFTAPVCKDVIKRYISTHE